MKMWKKILFWLIPAHWGLRGNLLEKAKIEWFVDDPYEKEIRLCEIDTSYLPENEKKKALLKIKKKYGKIGDYEYEMEMVELEKMDEIEKELRKAEIRKKYRKILDFEYEKSIKTAKGEPWFGIIRSSLDPDNMVIEMELDWNIHFIKKLKEMGFSGTEEEMVDSWFSKVCAIIAEEEGFTPTALYEELDVRKKSDINVASEKGNETER